MKAETVSKAIRGNDDNTLRLVIPKAIREHMGLKAGQRVLWVPRANGVVVLSNVEDVLALTLNDAGARANAGADHDQTALA